jgi:hypothetical protein
MVLFYARSVKIVHMFRRDLPLLSLLCLLAACSPAVLPVGTPTVNGTATATPFHPMDPTPTLTSTSTLPGPVILLAPTETFLPLETATSTPLPTPTSTPLPAELTLDPADWHHWPVIPIVSEKMREVYQQGQMRGNDAHVFSVIGDCQSEPNVFLGLYDTDPLAVAALPENLQETVAWFAGSFDRDGPTIRPGTTAAAVLWAAWHQNRYTCTPYETPLACELRLHRPSFMFIHVGTHYELRNEVYIRRIIDQLLAAGVVPILASKADNRELDERVNHAYAALAVEYGLPFWNFWAAVEDLPNRGLYTRPEVSYQGDVYLTPEAAAVHRLSALQALDAVWRAVREP